MKLWVLGSGSRGNAVLVESGDSRILIDVGFGPRILQRRLEFIGIAPESVEACVITHEHSDHIRGAARAARRWH
ncbi:MAG: MBL fold metallo-hydrolase, partial [Gemmatimonadaceae bacterium]